MNDFSAFSEEELFKLVKSGVLKAEEELAERYIHLPRAIARRSNLFLSGGDYDDLIQEGTLGLISAIRSYNIDGGAEFSTYAYKCIESRLLTAVKASGRKKHSPLNSGVPLEEVEDISQFSEMYDPETIFLAKENFEELNKTIDLKLSEAEKQVLRLYLEGESYRDIANKLDKNTKYVDNAVQRIRQKLTRILNSGEISKS